MLYQLRRAVLAVFLVLTVSAGTAEAACAFVLWEDTFTITDGSPAPKGGWSPEKTFATLSDCRAEAASRLQGWGRLVESQGTHDVLVYEDRASAIKKDTRLRDSILYSVKCLPDIIDPRGPKGK